MESMPDIRGRHAPSEHIPSEKVTELLDDIEGTKFFKFDTPTPEIHETFSPIKEGELCGLKIQTMIGCDNRTNICRLFMRIKTPGDIWLEWDEFPVKEMGIALEIYGEVPQQLADIRLKLMEKKENSEGLHRAINSIRKRVISLDVEIFDLIERVNNLGSKEETS